MKNWIDIIIEALAQVSNASKDGKIDVNELIMIVIKMYLKYGKEILK